MAGLSRLDAFVKTRPDLKQQSVAGGLITAIAATTAIVLFIGQLFFYITGVTRHSLFLSKSTSVPILPLPGADLGQRLADDAGKLPLTIHVTFLHLRCSYLDVQHDGASLGAGEIDKIHGQHSLKLRTPTAGELHKLGVTKPKPGNGCTVQGQLRPPIVAGVLAIGMSRSGWSHATGTISMLMRGARTPDSIEAMQDFNVTHYVHTISFGSSFPLAADKPLEGRLHRIVNEYGGLAVEHIQLKLVPTLYQRFFLRDETFQSSVARHTVQPQTLFSKGVPYMPGLVIAYDYSPLAVHHSGGRENFLVFLSSLVSIVGGAFVTVGLFTSCLVHSAQAVAKKLD